MHVLAATTATLGAVQAIVALGEGAHAAGGERIGRAAAALFLCGLSGLVELLAWRRAPAVTTAGRRARIVGLLLLGAAVALAVAALLVAR